MAGLGCAGIALSALTLHEVGELTALYVASLALGFSSGLALNPAYVEVSKRAPEQERGLVLATADVVVGVPLLFSPLLDPLSQALGSRGTLIPVVAASTIALGLVALSKARQHGLSW